MMLYVRVLRHHIPSLCDGRLMQISIDLDTMFSNDWNLVKSQVRKQELPSCQRPLPHCFQSWRWMLDKCAKVKRLWCLSPGPTNKNQLLTFGKHIKTVELKSFWKTKTLPYCRCSTSLNSGPHTPDLQKHYFCKIVNLFWNWTPSEILNWVGDIVHPVPLTCKHQTGNSIYNHFIITFVCFSGHWS